VCITVDGESVLDEQHISQCVDYGLTIKQPQLKGDIKRDFTVTIGSKFLKARFGGKYSSDSEKNWLASMVKGITERRPLKITFDPPLIETKAIYSVTSEYATGTASESEVACIICVAFKSTD